MSTANRKPAERLADLDLRVKHGGQIYLWLRDGIVVGAMGSEPARFVGKTEEKARHIARYGGR